MNGAWYLAWRYVIWHRWKVGILVAAVTLVLYLPLGLQLVIEQTARDMNARADATALVLGARGSPLELVLNALYFSDEQPPGFGYEAVFATSLAFLAIGGWQVRRHVPEPRFRG